MLIGYFGFYCYQLWTTSNSKPLENAVEKHVKVINKEMKEEKATISNQGAIQIQALESSKKSLESETKLFNILDDNQKSSIETDCKIINLMTKVIKKTNKNTAQIKENTAQIKENTNQININTSSLNNISKNWDFYNNEKTIKLLETLTFLDDKYGGNGNFLHALQGSFKLLFELSNGDLEKKSFKNINEEKPKIKPFSGKGRKLCDDEKL